jgi:hypothetical protein
MLGQHPELYGLPELHLLRYETVGEFLQGSLYEGFPIADGVLRTIAQLVFGEQSHANVQRSSSWLRRRSDWTGGLLIEAIAHIVSPLRLVEKSPSTVFEMEYMQRSLEMFPGARFLHLVRHPRAHGVSVIKYLNRPRAGDWLRRMASYCEETANEFEGDVSMDPQRSWYGLHRRICDFLEKVPKHQTMRVRGEDVLSEPDAWIPEIARWLEISSDEEAVAATKHPERSPYACFGPLNAPYGLDFYFLQQPVLRPARAETQTLVGPLPWRRDRAGFNKAVVNLARTFGYE